MFAEQSLVFYSLVNKNIHAKYKIYSVVIVNVNRDNITNSWLICQRHHFNVDLNAVTVAFEFLLQNHNSETFADSVSSTINGVIKYTLIYITLLIQTNKLNWISTSPTFIIVFPVVCCHLQTHKPKTPTCDFNDNVLDDLDREHKTKLTAVHA